METLQIVKSLSDKEAEDVVHSRLTVDGLYYDQLTNRERGIIDRKVNRLVDLRLTIGANRVEDVLQVLVDRLEETIRNNPEATESEKVAEAIKEILS
jgi:hypothetical protein